MKHNILSIILCSLLSVAAATSVAGEYIDTIPGAPFGLSWEPTAKPLCLTDPNAHIDTDADRALLECVVTDTPKPAKLIAFYRLEYIRLPNKMYQLGVVVAGTERTENDPFAYKAIDITMQIEKALTKKYGKYTSTDVYTGNYIWTEDQHRMQCYTDERCGRLIMFWTFADGYDIFLRIQGLDAFEGHVLVVYRSSAYNKYRKQKISVPDENSF